VSDVERSPGPEPSSAAGTTESLFMGATRLLVGATVVAAAGVAAVVGPQREGWDAPDDRDDAPLAGGPDAAAEVKDALDVASLAVGVFVSAAAELERRGARTWRLTREVARTALGIAHLTPLHGPLERARARMQAVSELGRIETGTGIAAVTEASDELLGLIVDRVLEHVDVNELAASVDVNELAATVDFDRIIDRIDLNEIAARIDIEAILHRLDLAGIAREVLDEIGVEDIIRESAGSLTVETVDALRTRGADADRRVSGLIDRALRRRGQRDLRVGNGTRDDPARPNGGAQ
jgi:hypothetical protein